MMGLNMEQVIKMGKTVLNIGSSLYILKSMGYFNKSNKVKNNKTYATNYYEVVSVIVNSNMLDSSKEKLIGLVENGKTPQYYKAVSDIANSDMLISTKVETIKMLK